MGLRRIGQTGWVEDGTEGVHTDRSDLDSGLNFLFLAAFPLVLWLFQGSFAGIATATALIWTLSLALRLISRGQLIHHHYDLAEVAQAPRIPRKLIGSVLIGLVVFVLAGHRFDNLWLPALSGLVATVLAIGAFGRDPSKDKGAERVRELICLDQAETAMAALADRVAALDDAELTLRIEAARLLILRPMRNNLRNPQVLRRLEKPVGKMVSLLTEEVTRLERAWGAADHVFARKRFLAKLEVMSESYEGLARHCGVTGARDAFERQADRLIDRMPRESAA